MCDEAGKSENQAPRQAAKQSTAQSATPGAATQVAAQVAAAATATPQVTAAATAHKAVAHKDTDSKKAQVVDPEFARAENEDDDGYDPHSDRRPVSEPLFERDPWS